MQSLTYSLIIVKQLRKFVHVIFRAHAEHYTKKVEAQRLSTMPSACERVEVVKAVPAGVTVGDLSVDQALADRRSGNRLIIRALLLGLLAWQADRLVVVDGKNALIFLAQLLMAAIALGCAGQFLFPSFSHGGLLRVCWVHCVYWVN
jgi:hypothetical protein